MPQGDFSLQGVWGWSLFIEITKKKPEIKGKDSSNFFFVDIGVISSLFSFFVSLNSS